jgi:PAS domain S-box-containing protein
VSGDAARLRDLFDLDFVLLLRRNGGLNQSAGAGPFVNEKNQSDPQRTELTDEIVFKVIGSKTEKEVEKGAPAAASAGKVLDDAVALIAAVGDDGGIVVAGRYVDALEMEEISSSAASAFATVIVGDAVAGSSLPCKNVADAKVVPQASLRSLETQGALTVQRDICNRPYFSAIRQLNSASDVPVATIVLSAPASLVAKTREGVTRILFLVAIGIGAVALLLAWLSGRRITRPIQALTTTAREVREGDLTATAVVVGDDEVGQLGETFNEMTGSLLRMTNDLREAAREEHRLRGRIETIIESMADGLIAVDAEKKVLAFNREAEQLTGLQADDVIGKPIEEVVKARDAQGQDVRLPIYDLAEGSMGGAFIEANGTAVPVAVTCAVLRSDDGELAGGVAVVRNMTREREIEKMKSEFLSNISHELRTPMTPIKGYAEILGRKDLPPGKTQQFAKGILDSTARLERIVQLLVDFSAMEAGRLSPKTTPVDLGALVTDVAGQWGSKSPRHQLVVDVKARLPKVLGDERLLRRSLEEILDNAVKFSPDGGTIKLEARGAQARNGAPRRRAVEVSVTDEGIGISPDDLSKIFSDFHQLDGSETRTYGGLGLGLAFVQRILEAHSGSVEVQSEPDEGTRFTMTIPAATRAKAPAQPPSDGE